MHQLQFAHKLGEFWQFNFNINNSKNTSNSLNYTNRNYELENTTIHPKLSYYYNKNTYFSFLYELKNKENKLGNLETLKLQKLGIAINYANGLKSLLKTEVNIFNNSFEGLNNSPVAYQMLEGLQPGKNYTWSLLFHKKLNSFLNLNLNYLGRKSETSQTVHTGTIQLKAIF